MRMSMNEIRHVVRQVISESEGRAALDIDAYKPAISRLLTAALEELQNERGDVLDAHLAQLDSPEGGGPGGDRIATIMSLRGEIMANPTKSVSATTGLINALRNRVSVFVSTTFDVDVSEFQSASLSLKNWSTEKRVSTEVAFLAADLLDQLGENMSMSSKATRVSRSVEVVAGITVEGMLDAVASEIRSQVDAISGDPADFEDRIGDIRKMLSDFGGSISLTTLEDFSSVRSFAQRWFESENFYLNSQISMYRMRTRRPLR